MKRGGYIKRTPLRRKSLSEIARCKSRIQDTLRQLAIHRDEGCVLRNIATQEGLKQCSGFRKDGKLILQYDHLISRTRNISYAELDLGVILCKGHHGWKSFTDDNSKRYDEVIKKVLSQDRLKKWERFKNDRKSYSYGEYEWRVIEIILKQELKEHD